MNKKIAILALALCMVAAIAVTGTIAYFTDAEGATNVMKTGNVKIVQNEQQRGENDLEDFKDDKKLAPYTGSVLENGVANAWGTSAMINGTEYKMFDTNKNAIDKIVTVTNKGTEEAYIRTLFAFEVPKNMKDGEEFAFLYDRTLNITADTDFEDVPATFKYGDVEYVVCVTYYADESKLASGKTSKPSMRQIYLNANSDNEWYDNVGETYNILALTQATQTQGFTSAEEALNAAFGDPMTATTEKLAAWFAECVEIDIGF